MIFFIWNLFISKLFLLIEVIILFFFVACSLNPFFSLEAILGAGFLGIAFPYFFIAVLVCLVFNLILKPRWAVLILVILALNWKQIFVCFAPHLLPQDFYFENKSPQTIRILNWNVQRFLPYNSNNLNKSKWTEEHTNIIEHYKPDIICFQEYLKKEQASPFLQIEKQLKKLGYLYFSFSNDYQIGNEFQSGNIIFSKLPIQGQETIRFTNLDAGLESLMYVDVKGLNNKTLRIYTTHLQSYGFKSKEYQYMNQITHQFDERWHSLYYLFTKMRNTFLIRKQQTDVLKSYLKSNSQDFILCGDFNDIPNSYTYNMISENLHDAFLDKGWGIGNTYKKILPTLRIDYIFSSPKLQTIQYEKINTTLSDHFPIVADIQY